MQSFVLIALVKSFGCCCFAAFLQVIWYMIPIIIHCTNKCQVGITAQNFPVSSRTVHYVCIVNSWEEESIPLENSKSSWTLSNTPHLVLFCLPTVGACYHIQYEFNDRVLQSWSYNTFTSFWIIYVSYRKFFFFSPTQTKKKKKKCLQEQTHRHAK